MKENVLKIINHYGVNHQQRKFQEEVFELNEAIINFNANKFLTPELGIEHIAEEIADVMVILKQFQMYYEINRDEIRDIMRYKIERQLERIENENK